MVQRVQTVWLFFAAITLASLFLFPSIHFLDHDGVNKVFKVNGVYENINGQLVQNQSFLLLTISTITLSLIPVIAIFFYRNRKQQILICYFIILFILGHSFWIVQVAKQVTHNVNLGIDNYNVGLILPSIAILFIILAIRGIRKDEKLIKSADRLR